MANDDEVNGSGANEATTTEEPVAQANEGAAAAPVKKKETVKKEKPAVEPAAETETETENKVMPEPVAETKSDATAETATPNPTPENFTEPEIDKKTSSVESITNSSAAKPEAGGDSLFDVNKLGILNDVYVVLTIEVGRSHIKIRELLNLKKGSIIELDKLAGEPVDIYANGKLISKGNIILANGKYCVRLISINDKKNLGA
jgi:flagellar motor switch protein FliN/FliY